MRRAERWPKTVPVVLPGTGELWGGVRFPCPFVSFTGPLELVLLPCFPDRPCHPWLCSALLWEAGVYGQQSWTQAPGPKSGAGLAAMDVSLQFKFFWLLPPSHITLHTTGCWCTRAREDPAPRAEGGRQGSGVFQDWTRCEVVTSVCVCVKSCADLMLLSSQVIWHLSL
jgi:hypothetical protein